MPLTKAGRKPVLKLKLAVEEIRRRVGGDVRHAFVFCAHKRDVHFREYSRYLGHHFNKAYFVSVLSCLLPSDRAFRFGTVHHFKLLGPINELADETFNMLFLLHRSLEHCRNEAAKDSVLVGCQRELVLDFLLKNLRILTLELSERFFNRIVALESVYISLRQNAPDVLPFPAFAFALKNADASYEVAR